MRGLQAVTFPVEDLEAATAFYAALLGHSPTLEEAASTVFDVEGFGGARAYWGVEDVDAAVGRGVELGAVVLQPPTDLGGGVIVAAVRDPAGNALGFTYNPDFRAGLGARLAAVGQQLEEPIIRTARVPASSREVFAAWTTSEGMGSWLAPATIELRVGGRFELHFDRSAPPGLRGSEGCQILAYQPPRLLAFTWNAPPHLATRAQRTWVVLEIVERRGRSEVTLTHTGWPRVLTKDWLETYAYFEEAWDRVLQALSRHFGG
jgi:uncharacterized protein YndB with AHSA1/START domain/predicted enzyme related to lactoylglutathione lyase